MSTPRPRSVTLGCVYGGLGGAITAVLLIQALSNWGSIAMQDALHAGFEKVGSDVDVAAILTPLRWLATVLLIASIAAAVFAVYAARGHQASRIGLSVLAALACLGSLLSGLTGVFTAVISALVVYLLWSAPARHWYAVVNGKVPLSLGVEPSGTTPTPVVSPPSYDLPRPVPHQPGTVAPPPYDPTAQRAARPRPVTIALAVAGIGSIIGAVLSALALVLVVALRAPIVDQYAASPFLRDQLESSGMSAEQVVTLATWLFGAWLAVSVLGLVAVAWAATGRRSGWWALVVTAVVVAGTAALGLPLGAVWIVGAIVVVVQITRPEARAWYSWGHDAAHSPRS